MITYDQQFCKTLFELHRSPLNQKHIARCLDIPTSSKQYTNCSPVNLVELSKIWGVKWGQALSFQHLLHRFLVHAYVSI